MLRRMAVGLPATFPELAALSDADEERDFFANVAHLQLHRRTRALARLSKVRLQKQNQKIDNTYAFPNVTCLQLHQRMHAPACRSKVRG